MLVIEIYNALKQAQLVSTLEEYSTQWLNKHKTTASYLIHKKRDLSLISKLNCIKNINNKINQIENGDELVKKMEDENLLNLKNLKNYILNKINSNYNIELV